MQHELHEGLYTPELESDACGTGLIARLDNSTSHDLITNALTMLENMEHRGACGCEANTGDGAGILVNIPHRFLTKACANVGFELPDPGAYGVGMIFFPKDDVLQKECRIAFNDYLEELGFDLLGYRKVPTDNSTLGHSAIRTEPKVEQIFVVPKNKLSSTELERKLYVLRQYVTHTIHKTFPQTSESFYINSFSGRTIVYKGQLTTYQLKNYYPDLQDPLFESSLAMIHSRFATNTFPRWQRSQPFRFIAHNGEINTVVGNLNWWKSKESTLVSKIFTEEELEYLLPVLADSQSDSANFDNVLEFLLMSGRSLPHALMMMIPEAWQENLQMVDYKRAFYEYHKLLMEPWDGPAAICFTDGKVIGATLDRNGLRPLRYQLTSDNVLIVASEAGVVPYPQDKIIKKGRLKAGRMLLADLEEHRIIGDEELKETICQALPYRDWLDEHRVALNEIPEAKEYTDSINGTDIIKRQKLFGFTKEDIKFLFKETIRVGKDPIGSMGADTPLAVLSSQTQHLANYFKQLFAQVTNPPIDPIRERSVMSLFTTLGPKGDILNDKAENARFIHLEQPILSNEDIDRLQAWNPKNFKVKTVDILFEADGQKGRLRAALDHICATAEDLVRNGFSIIMLSDRKANEKLAPIPSLLAMGAVHHHLIKLGLRNETSLIAIGGDIRETHHMATLIGYGANAVNPYLTIDTLRSLNKKELLHKVLDDKELLKTYIKASGKGLLKIFSKVGISTLQSYHGAQIFEAVGIQPEVIEMCFKGTISRIKGIGFDEIAEEVLVKHREVYRAPIEVKHNLPEGGVYQWKRRGEYHLFNPQSIHLLQYSTRKNDYTAYKKYAKIINDQNEQACTLRGLLGFRKGDPIPIEEVEPASSILKRFATGAMSFGSLSHEAHSTLAIAMNRIGAKSNSGEGGEDEIRYLPKENGDWERSAIKQVASGRFGVTANYLANADELQIKMAQGAKPGEGGQLPGHKVDDWIARVRHSTPGVGLISPPPHHDIYSIEDLKQLIFDLKNANRKARINVKLVSKAGVGVIASGVAKAHADVILISGHDGGTGASPLTSIRYAGLPWELGLAETQQTLVKNNLRDRVVVQTDGQIRTGRDIAIATLLGAEEWGVATAALVVEGCIMMRKCHLNTCPVGVATQDPELRKRFKGDPQHVINFFNFLVQDLREIMAQLGFRTINEMVGKVEMLKQKSGIQHWKYKNVDLSPILYREPVESFIGLHKSIEQDHEIDNVLDWQLIKKARPAIERKHPVKGLFSIANTDRAVGTMLSNEVAKKYGSQGLPEKTIQFNFRGSAGQSFGAFSSPGMEFRLEGEANDYCGKGLSGGRLIIVPDQLAKFKASENIIIGNVAFYGATSGEAYINGMAGERFCVRNSGVHTVVEGIGDHGCEYMTGGRVVILGETGDNFAAGMSGGIAYVYDPKRIFKSKCNLGMVTLDEMEESDIDLVKSMIQKHNHYTNSELGIQILLNWGESLSHFHKVMPTDYKRILEKRAQDAHFIAKEARA